MSLSESFFVQSSPRAANGTAAIQTPGSAVSLRGVSHSYKRSDGTVLADVGFDIAPGSVVALLGRSGCGKSTLLHILSGLISPSAGAVSINGTAVTGPSPKWVMMFQAPSLYPWMSVAENVALGLRFTGRKSDAATRVPQVLDLVDLGAFADRNVQDLSGGQQQRVALARSLATDPEMLLLDEPFSALDAFTRRALQRDVRTIAKRLGITLVLVSHDVSEAVSMSDRVLLMDAGPGRIAQDTDITLSEGDRTGGTNAATAEIERVSQLYARIAGQP